MPPVSWLFPFDGTATAPCAYRVVIDYKAMGAEEVAQMAKLQPKGGNLLEIRGLAGTSIDDAIHTGIVAGIKAHPNFKIVSSVAGDWDQTTTQKAVATVLPSLPQIVGVVDQGGDGYGAAQAFAAAHKPRPTIIMGNRQDELSWWQSRSRMVGATWSASIAPGISTLAFWVAQQQVLDGNNSTPRRDRAPSCLYPGHPRGGAEDHPQGWWRARNIAKPMHWRRSKPT